MICDCALHFKLNVNLIIVMVVGVERDMEINPDLFVINRYWGDDEKPEQSPSEKKKKKRLSELLEHIRAQKQLRQKERQVEDVNESETTEGVDTERRKEKKKKKRKKDENIDEESEVVKYDNKRMKAEERVTENEQESDRNTKGGDNALRIFPETSDTHTKAKKRKKKNKENVTEEDTSRKQMVPNVDLNGSVDDLVTSDVIEGFTVIGEVSKKKRERVKRVLPQWLVNPCIVSVNLKISEMSIDQMPLLDQELVDKLRKNGVTHFFPVQRQVIPWLIESASLRHFWPSDICVSAPTGSGKTLAYVLPLVQALKTRVVPRVRALVVLPVQDLARQVYRVFSTYTSGSHLRVALLTGQQQFLKEQSVLVRKGLTGFQSLVDIIVTTPGRLVDHIQQTEGFSLKYLRFLVIDEADRVMEDMEANWLTHVEKAIALDSKIPRSRPPLLTVASIANDPRPPQKLLFSATLSQDPEKLQQLGLFQPKLFTSVVEVDSDKINDVEPDEGQGDFVGKYTTPAELNELYTVVEASTKPLVLYHLIKKLGWDRILCFTNSVETTHRLSVLLSSFGDIRIGEVSSRFKRVERERIVQKFSAGELNILVSSDALARGMDITGVEVVISYDVPPYVKTYIHRIGRTGRAGKEGTAITLLLSKEVNHFQEMLEVAGKKEVTEMCIPEEDLEPLEDIYKDALVKLKETLSAEEKKELLQVKREKKKRRYTPNKNSQPKKTFKMKKKQKRPLKQPVPSGN